MKSVENFEKKMVYLLSMTVQNKITKVENYDSELIYFSLHHNLQFCRVLSVVSYVTGARVILYPDLNLMNSTEKNSFSAARIILKILYYLFDEFSINLTVYNTNNPKISIFHRG